jgi:UDP-3-O-[3-hydroxymyristoyl] glucosamine N-acyltransferase
MDLPKEFSLAEIAAVAGAKVGSGGDTKVKRVSVSPLSAKEGDLALFFDPKMLDKLSECKATAVLIPEGVETKLPHIVVKRPQLALQRMLSAMQPPRFLPPAGVHPTAVVDPSAQLGEGVAVGPNVVIGPKTVIGKNTKIAAGSLIGGAVKIGENCVFHQGCLIADYVQIGNRVSMQQGASVGADGFAYVTERPSNMEVRMAGGKELSDDPNPPLKIPQIGTVIIEDDVEIGSYTTIDRATMGATVIGAHTKIDNLVMVAHNNRIGKECLIVAGAAIAGSCVIGDRVVMAGQAGLKDHLRIGKDAIIQGQAGVIGDLEDKAVVVGSPAMPVREFWEGVASQKRIPKINKQVREMQQRIEKLEKALLERQLETTSK